jgi:hypothetical protein
MTAIIGHFLAALLLAALSALFIQPLPSANFAWSLVCLITAVILLGLAFGQCRRGIGVFWRMIYPPLKVRTH